ncbi:protein of unknown function [Shewanella benthica]|uniref:Uncharacterized protein n=1 Tax=Shewanella benthica TaxID=43661 RepID=A0A330LX63_9GAMM|nr:protein of unknown function [Shewanella benthica]
MDTHKIWRNLLSHIWTLQVSQDNTCLAKIFYLELLSACEIPPSAARIYNSNPKIKSAPIFNVFTLSAAFPCCSSFYSL